MNYCWLHWGPRCSCHSWLRASIVRKSLEAAIVCNHKRTIPKTWESSLQRKKERLEAQRARARENERKLRQLIMDADGKHLERLGGYERKLREHEEKLEEYRRQLKESEKQGRSTESLEKGIASKQKAMNTQRQRMRKLNTTHVKRMGKLRRQLRDRKERDVASTEKLELQIRAQEATKDFNLGTSLKSYVDHRIYYDYGRRVDYDWKKYNPKTLQSKFSWVENNSRGDSEEE